MPNTVLMTHSANSSKSARAKKSFASEVTFFKIPLLSWKQTLYLKISIVYNIAHSIFHVNFEFEFQITTNSRNLFTFVKK